MSEVLVVGSGPSGLALACELYRRGVPCRVIDQQRAHVDRSRAVDLQPRTLHYLDDLGVVDGLLTRGRLLRGLSVYDRAIRLARIDYRAADTPFPFAVAIPQSETEQTLERKLEALGGRVERGVTLRRLVQDDDGVQVWLHDSGGESSSTYRWVVGCDGVTSTVRDACGIEFAALAAPQSFVAADAVVRWRYPNDELALFLFEDSFLLALPLLGDGCMRLIADVGTEEGKPTQLDAFAAMASARIGTQVWLEEPGFVGTYHARRRLASAFRDRRVLLVGDAAHSYNPIGGHGMNQGIQDAYNLGWKLALVVRGRSDEGLLDSYEAERRAVARDFARDMDFGARLALANQDVSREERDRLLDFAVKSPSVRRAVLDSALPHLSVYDESPIVGEVLGRGFASPSGTSAGSFAPDVRAGAGAPSIVELLRGTEHLLLLFCGADDVGASAAASAGGEVRERFGDVARVVLVAGDGAVAGWDGPVLADAGGAVHARYGAAEPCAYLVRPDGHIGFRACPLEVAELLDYLGRLFTG